jgi:mannose-6-phosphate isomerase-like protein (cupin superfamily)
MSYPPPAYDGDSGETSAWIRPGDSEPDLAYGSGGRVDYLATGAQTGGAFGLYRWTFGPGQTGPEPHFHRTISESFFILSGTVQIHDGTDWRDTGPGDFAHVPPGGVHGFRNVAGTGTSMLLMFSPGAPREEYFETLKKLGEGLVMTSEEKDAFFAAHDNYWV